MAFHQKLGAALLLATLALASPGAAIACSPATLCPGSGACTISGANAIPDGCRLDFGIRTVRVVGSLRAATTGGSFAISAGSLDLDGGQLFANGTADAPGGHISVDVTGAVLLRRAGARIDVGAAAGGGTVSIRAGSINLSNGAIDARGGDGASCDDAGEITLTATGPVVIDATLTASTPAYDCDGGGVEIIGGSVDVRKTIHVGGGHAPKGIHIEARTGNLAVASAVRLIARGEGHRDADGNDGGPVHLVAKAGNVTLAGKVDAAGSSPDGAGGELIVSASGLVQVSNTIDATGGGGTGDGGIVDIQGGAGVSVTSSITARGGSSARGGTISLAGGGTVTVGSTLAAGGGSRAPGSIRVSGEGGAVRVTGVLDTRDTGGVRGGPIEVEGCSVELTGSAVLDTRSTTGTAAGSVRVAGGSVVVRSNARIDATPCTAPSCISILTATGLATVEAGALLAPSPPTLATDPESTLCCGNGVRDAGEDCDDGNARWCDGCSPSCRFAQCPSDGNPCTSDCEPTHGCFFRSITGPGCGGVP